MVVLAGVDDEQLRRELLVKTSTELVGTRRGHARVSEEVQRYVGSVPALPGTNVHSDDALVVGIEHHLQVVLVGIIGVKFFL